MCNYVMDTIGNLLIESRPWIGLMLSSSILSMMHHGQNLLEP